MFLGLLVPYLLSGHIALGSALGAVVCAALLYAIYRRDRAANPRVEEVVSDRHFAEIRAIVARLEASTRSNRPSKYADEKDRLVISQHFPKVSSLLDEWDRSINFVYERTTALTDRFKSEAMKRGIVTPQFKVENVVALFFTATLLRADQGTLNFEMKFKWDRRPDTYIEGGMPVCLFLRPNPDALVQLSAGSEFKLVPEENCKSWIEKLFWDSQSWPETLACATRDRDSGWPELKPRVLDALDDLIKRDNFRKGKGCVRCQ